jgi:uncharacterized membrane protein
MTEATVLDPAPRATSEDLTLPIVCYVLYLLMIPTGGLAYLAGVIIAYAQRDGAGPAARSHYEFLIRTFWLSLVGLCAGVALCVVGGVLSVVLIGIPILLAGVALLGLGKLWFVIRCVLGIAKAAQKEAYPRPDAVLA